MLKNREGEINSIVAVDENSILAPCGGCGELIAQVSPNNYNTIALVNDERAVTIADLLARFEQ